MPFDQIMESIQAGLTGDSRKDIRYLQDQIAFHRNHENGLEIARACGRLIYERLPDELKKKPADTSSQILDDAHQSQQDVTGMQALFQTRSNARELYDMMP